MTSLERAAIKASGIPGWTPWIFTGIKPGMVRVHGAVLHPITRGPNKGKPNYRKPVAGTVLDVIVTSRMIEAMLRAERRAESKKGSCA